MLIFQHLQYNVMWKRQATKKKENKCLTFIKHLVCARH